MLTILISEIYWPTKLTCNRNIRKMEDTKQKYCRVLN